MTTTPFTDGWTVRAADSIDSVAVTLPHDAMIGELRSAAGGTGSHGGYFPGGRYVYAKKWTAPETGRHSLFFEGVQGQATIRLNGEVIGVSTSVYREFAVPLDGAVAGSDNLIEVEVDNSAVPNSRWYTGSGIYRRVWLEEVAPIGFTRDGVRIRTVSVGDPAIVEIDVEITDPETRDARVVVRLDDAGGEAEGVIENGRATLQLRVPQPRLWSDTTPHLYAATVDLVVGGEMLDGRVQRVGLRTVQVDARHGLRINGERVLLRGACVHHDSGVLGAATLRASEFRRARILKEGGFNAIRSSHNPLSRDLLDACDEHGLYVLDELTDVWFGPKSAHDSAPRFEHEWRDDARSMIAKDRNHPSVIMYSIGNEIAESGTPRGIETARAISDFVRDLDPERPTTLAVNFLLNFMASSGKSLFDATEHDPAKQERQPSAISSTIANVMANRIGGMMQTISRLPKSDKVTRDTFPTVDVAGYNYAWGRYAGDVKRYPERVVLGSESMPGDIPKIWALAKRLPNVIGDFTWTGWDYLGETGIGTWSYGAETTGIGKKYPELIAGCGLIDITGHPGAALLLSQAAWGLLPAPQIAVHPLDHAGESVHRTAWRSTDAVQSWAWAGADGRRAEVDVYSSDDQVELVLNGRSLGRKAAGERRGFVTRFRVPYEPGEITAIGYRDGVETGRSSLRSAGAPSLRLVTDRDAITADGQDLAFLRVELADADGVVETLASDLVSVEVIGAGRLAALGSAAPSSTESFTDAEHSTWRGRALAVVRAGDEAGEVEVCVTSRHHGSATLTLAVTGSGVLA